MAITFAAQVGVCGEVTRSESKCNKGGGGGVFLRTCGSGHTGH